MGVAYGKGFPLLGVPENSPIEVDESCLDRLGSGLTMARTSQVKRLLRNDLEEVGFSPKSIA